MRSALLDDMHVSLHDARQAGAAVGTRVPRAFVPDGAVVPLQRRSQHVQLPARVEHDDTDEAVHGEYRHAADNRHDRLRDVDHLVHVRLFQRERQENFRGQPPVGRVPRMVVEPRVPERHQYIRCSEYRSRYYYELIYESIHEFIGGDHSTR